MPRNGSSVPRGCPRGRCGPTLRPMIVRGRRGPAPPPRAVPTAGPSITRGDREAVVKQPAGTPPNYLFVYGTLRASSVRSAHRLLAGRARLVDTGWVPGRLYDTGAYPAAVAPVRPGERVRGEVYHLPPQSAAGLLTELDEYEGHVPHAPAVSLFRRERARVTGDTGRIYPAWMYRYNRPTDRLPRIPSGDYAAPSQGPGSP